MEMKRLNSGRLAAAGYDSRERVLRVEFSDGQVIEYTGVGDEVWRRLSTSGAAWSYFRDNIEEDFATRRPAASVEKKPNPLDELFKK